jgi:D-amino-acid dehydrogenase
MMRERSSNVNAASALVLGGGIIGTTTAYCLAKHGLEVTVVERCADVGLQTSFANAGLITPSQADPWNAPGTALKLIKWLGREDSPLLLRLRAVPSMAGWLLRFLLASREREFHRSMLASARLALFSAARLKRLRGEEHLDYDANLTGTIKVFADHASLAEAVELANVLRHEGVPFEHLTAQAAVAKEPALGDMQSQLAGAIYYPNDESGDAHKFTQAMAHCCRRLGVTFKLDTTIERISTSGGRVTGIETSAGPLAADAYVLAAGSYSPLLAATAGLRVPVRPVKGYSLTLPRADWRHAPNIPVVDFGRKIIVARLGERIRVAGTAELAGYDHHPNPVRGNHMLEQAFAMFPSLREHVQASAIQHWAGLRPATPDGPPILGASPLQNLFFNTGQGPLGWTMAAGSAQVVADIVAGQAPAIDTPGLTFSRFKTRI